jgi:hypothetical protein
MPTSEYLKLKVEFEGLKRDVKHIGEDVAEMKDDMKSNFDTLHGLMKDVLDEAEKKYAAKWTERIIIWLGTGIGIALVGSLMKLLLAQ